MNPLESFINDQCARHPAALMPLSAFVAAFRASLPVDLQPAYKQRSRIVADLVRLGYPVGLVDGSYHVGGLAVGKWQAAGGQLVLA